MRWQGIDEEQEGDKNNILILEIFKLEGWLL